MKAPTPLSGLPPTETHLKNAPLARVICQVRFASVLALTQRAGIVAFQEIIRTSYPVLAEERQQHISVAPNGALSLRDEVVWRFSDRARAWRVSLATDFVALETTAYATRKDFRDRLAPILLAIEKSVSPQEANRIGIRYINRMASESADDAVTLFAPGALGVYRKEFRPFTEHLVSEIGLRCDEGHVLARTAYVPAGVTPDRAAIDILDEDSWLLDLDVFSGEATAFDADAISKTATALAERAYAVFRAMVSDNFIERFKGDA